MEGHILSNIGKRLIPPYVEVRKPRYLTQNECERLLESAKGNIRDYAIIQLLLNTGIKLSELVGLTLDDYHITNMMDKRGNRVEYIRVRGNQNGKGRTIPINPETGRAITSYLPHRGTGQSSNLFLNKSGKSLGKRGVEKIIEKYFKVSGIINASVNTLRHTFRIHQTIKGTNLKTLNKIMGVEV